LNPVCPYCRSEVGDAEGERKDCPGCGTPHHSDCFAENGGCTVFGCSQAPSDEAKVTVSGTDLQGNVITRNSVPAIPQPGFPLANAPAVRSGFSLGSGYITFRAPVLDSSSPAPAEPVLQAPTVPATAVVPPPPPPIVGTGVAPPPAATASFQAPTYAPSQLVNYYQPPAPKTRVLFVLLGIFLGALGVHNFYAGYIKKGTIQLCLTVLTCFYGAALSWPWAIIEICTVNKDAEGAQFV